MMRRIEITVRRILALLCLFLLALVVPVHAAEIHIPLMQAPPTIDGVIHPEEWAGAYQIDGFAWNGALERRRVIGYVGADSTHVYMAIRSQLPEEGSLLAEVKRGSSNLVYDDSVEFWIEPTFGKERGQRYQIMLNSLGFHWYRMQPYGGVAEDPNWEGDWKVASTLHDGYWDCDVSIPLATLTPGRTAQQGAWGINICRNWKQEWAWSSLDGAGYAPSDSFVFSPDPVPIAHLEQRSDPFTGKISDLLVLHNPGSTPLDLATTLDLERDVMPPLKNSTPLHLGAEESKEIPLQVEDASTRKFNLTARVTSPDGKTLYLEHKVNWPAAAPFRWIAQKRVNPPIDLQFAYYPYTNRMRILADVSHLPKDVALESLTATISKEGGPVVHTVSFKNLVAGRQEVNFSLPSLEGKYQIALQALGKNVPKQPIIKHFERTRFPWENGKLGKSHTVYPPFTPIRIVGTRVSTVLRDHEMNRVGLWSQVTAKQVPLLSAPMRWEVTTDHRPITVTPGALKFTQKAGDRSRTQTGFHAGSLAAEVSSTWDYDGTMRVDLTLAPTAGKTIDGLTLVIPLKAEAAQLLHAMGDGIRNTLSLAVPDKQGVVWTSHQVQSDDLPRNFCTYLFVGTPNRGLCWFAENDRNWGWDPKTPNIELVRTGASVEMRIHLINRPETIKTTRTLTFGLLAAPIKPRLGQDWRYKYRRDNYHLLGTDINWLALGDCGSVYPAGRDLTLWEMIGKGNTQKLSDAEIQSVIDRGKPYFAPYGTEKINTFINHVRFNLTSHLGQNMIFYYNRASYQAAEEFETFKDEWGLSDYRSIEKGNSIGEIKIVPSASYIDHALYWYGKSFDLGRNRGVYWDNWFFVGSYNTEMTPAYTASDGTVSPSTGIWELRELEKRTFQYMNERGMPPITMPHMTSTSILPMLSFATVQYDWEWKYSEGDVQGRFPRNYILLVSDGELAGTWPVVLGDHGKQENDPWVGRTFAAVCMLHELDCAYPSYTEVGKMQLALFKPIDALLAQPGVQVYRYWDDRPQPVRATEPDLPSIVYAVKGKEAIIAIVSYADEDSSAHITIDPKALGFTSANGYQLQDAETGEEISVTKNHLTLPIKKHDLRLLRIIIR